MGVAPLVVLAVIGGSVLWAAPPRPAFTWTTVVNNNTEMPEAGCLTGIGVPVARKFNSYNQPSVNLNGMVVMRARSIGGPPCGRATHGIYTRDMETMGAVAKVLDRRTEVPQPNNVHYPPWNEALTPFIETPSFPRIDLRSNTIATRGNHQTVWGYTLNDAETRAGTTGIYANPFGSLITGANKLGAVPGFEYFAVPGAADGTYFDVFPGSPAVTGGDTIVFKGNYTVEFVGRTGVFYRVLKNETIGGVPTGGTAPVVLIANNTSTLIPGSDRVFGSLSPPSAEDGHVVFAGFDDEMNPTLGGIYLAPLMESPVLTPLVEIGSRVPGESSRSWLGALGEGAAFDGRYVGFWGAWGADTVTVRLYCPTEGNKDRIDYCNQRLTCEGTDTAVGDEHTRASDGIGHYQDVQVPVRQGIFVHDTLTGKTLPAAKTGSRFDDLLFWVYAGRTPCSGSGGHGDEGGEDDGEAVRWRSSAFVGVSGLVAAFKASGRDGVGIYLFDQENQDTVTVADTRMAGQVLDPEAPAGSVVTELGLEREGLRGDRLVISAKMGVAGASHSDHMAGIYMTRLVKPAK
jgi:hypothetical protein